MMEHAIATFGFLTAIVILAVLYLVTAGLTFLITTQVFDASQSIPLAFICGFTTSAVGGLSNNKIMSRFFMWNI